MAEREIRPFSVNRLVLSDIYDIFLKKHYMTGILEADVTKPKKQITNLKAKGVDISFSGWILYCLSEAIQRHPQVYTYRKGKRNVVQFKDIDIILMIEKVVNGKHIPIPYSVRSTQVKTLHQITDEIRTVQSTPTSEKKQLLGDSWLLNFYRYIPKWIRLKLIERQINNPDNIKKQGGLAVITSIGMFTSSYGWVLGFGGITPINIAIGTSSRQPRYVNENIEPRDILNLTINIDHDIIDGGPATRFVSDFTTLLEEGYGLGDLQN